MKCTHDFVLAEFYFASYWTCRKCDHRPTEREWNHWAQKQQSMAGAI